MLEAWALVALIRRNGAGEAGPDRHSRVRPVGAAEAAVLRALNRQRLVPQDDVHMTHSSHAALYGRIAS